MHSNLIRRLNAFWEKFVLSYKMSEFLLCLKLSLATRQIDKALNNKVTECLLDWMRILATRQLPGLTEALSYYAKESVICIFPKDN